MGSDTIQGGFSFCGVDIYEFGLEYAPENANTYVYNAAAKNIEEQKFEGHEGGYFYGVQTGPKDFTLRCYYEDTDIRDGIFSKVAAHFKVGRTGKLVFQKRPWVWYSATVMSVENQQLVNFKNGFVTIKMRAYYPYARSDKMWIDPYDLDQYDMLRNSAVLTDENKVPAVELVDDTPMTATTSFLLYNPGTERAYVAIEIGGDVGDGVTITNATTDQSVKFVAIGGAATANKWVVLDSLNGKTILTNGTDSQLAFLYHDYGFLQLEPAYPIYRNVVATWEEGATSITVADEITEDVVGMHIYLEDAWHKITAVTDGHTITISDTLSNDGTADTEIVLMNEITVEPKGTMSLTRLNFRYSPTFA